jgi:molecular chaperone IbpA
MRTNFDFTPYRRSTVGFDRLFDLLETSARGTAPDNYPPFDIERSGDDAYRITIAVAGFKADDIELTAQANKLLVVGKKAEAEGEAQRQFVHRGIATRAFERRFELADYVQVSGASLDDGLLTIDLVREVPEAMKPRTIAISGQTPVLEVAKAA